jgi:hypothetical protein
MVAQALPRVLQVLLEEHQVLRVQEMVAGVMVVLVVGALLPMLVVLLVVLLVLALVLVLDVLLALVLVTKQTSARGCERKRGPVSRARRAQAAATRHRLHAAQLLTPRATVTLRARSMTTRCRRFPSLTHRRLRQQRTTSGGVGERTTRCT